MTRAAAFFVLAATAIVYAAMLLWSLPALTAIAAANGLADARMFDMRPGGYDFETAKALLAALGEAGRERYVSVQQRLDTVFPLLNGLSIAIGLVFVSRRLGIVSGPALAVIAALASAVAGFDLAENASVARLLRAGPDNVTEAMVAVANRFTLLKSGAVTTALTLLLAGLALWAYRLWRNRKGKGAA